MMNKVKLETMVRSAAVFLALVSMCALAQEGAIESLRSTGKAFAAVARAVSPSVVFIQVESRVQATGMAPFASPFGEQWPFGDDLFRRFFGEPGPGVPRSERPPEERRAVSQGSGFVFAADGESSANRTYILTNNHVVANADAIRVKFADGREFDASVKGADPKSDVAVIEIETGGLPGLPLADSSKLEVGEWVVAIGNPFGLSHTLTVGVVSAKGRTSLGINDYEDFIQTDAAINPGNSGGPLVNLNGEVVGINTAIFSRSGGYMGVGFAIPINLAKAIADQLIEVGTVQRGYLGIIIQALTPELAESFGLGGTKGVLVAKVSDGSPAAAAGLRQGDVIVAYRGDPVDDVGAFRNRVSLTRPGSRAELTIVRSGERQKLLAIIGELEAAESVEVETGQAAEDLGIVVETLTPELAKTLGVEEREGVIVTKVKPGSIAAAAGIEAGTQILQVNRKPVGRASEFRRAIDASRAARRVLLLVRKAGLQQYVVLSW